MVTRRIVLVLCCSFLCYVASEDQTPGPVLRCDEPDVFHCGGGHCIAVESVCDGKPDCPDGQDEPQGQCPVNECLEKNGNCSQTSVDPLASFDWSCFDGYTMGSDGRTCEDIDECDVPGTCAQICHNENGTYRCDCEDGYLIDPVDNRRCKVDVGKVSLILSNMANILEIPLTDRKLTLSVKRKASAYGLDFIYRTGVFFWSDMIDKKIYKATGMEGDDKTKVISGEEAPPYGLAVDWIYNHIYWIALGVINPTVGVANLDGSMRKTLFKHGLKKPKDIVVNPLEGWLFWSDSGLIAKIERAGLDGSHRKTIVSSEIASPSGLTLDWAQRRIYWADGMLNVISSSDYDGSGRRQILHDTEALRHQFSLSVFEDHLFWTNFIKGAIRRAQKYNGSDVTILKLMDHPMELKVYHRYTQPEGDNHCGTNNGNCSHLCLPAPQVDQNSPKTTCACPDGFFLMSGSLECGRKGPVLRCDQRGEFDCGGGHCIAIESVCDGKPDCPDGQDEQREQCRVNECLENNGNCSQTCVDTLTSFYCTCMEGYTLGNDGSTCDDVDECDIPGSCSQICHNENGTFRCDCEVGYVIDPVDNRCKGKVSLILATPVNIVEISPDDQERTVLVGGTKFFSGPDFLYRTGVFFWSDIEVLKIYRASIKEGNDTTEVISETDGCPSGLTVDWIYNHIYWIVTGMSLCTVAVANLDGGMRKTLITDGLQSPSAIAVNPIEGWLFWSDSGWDGKIERAGLDGTHRQIIVSSNIVYPWCLTLDLVQRRIYWADAKLQVISSSDYDGSGRIQILHDTEALQYPLSIGVFEDHLYWTNKLDQTIGRANKFNGSGVTVFDFVADAVQLKVYHPYTQPEGVNHCGTDNGHCSHLCLPAPQVDRNSPKTTCACPDGLFLMSGGLKCTGNATMTKTERTFIMINPDGVQGGLVGELINEFISRGFNLVTLKMASLTADLVKTHRVDVSDKPFFLDLAKNVSSGSVVYMVWTGFNVVNTSRSMLETAGPQEFAAGTVRGDFGMRSGRNMVYGSDTVESAEEDIALWFGDSEILS